MSTQPKGRDSSGQGGRIRRQPERNSLSPLSISKRLDSTLWFRSSRYTKAGVARTTSEVHPGFCF